MQVPLKKAIAVLKHIHSHGYEAYFVGGAIRDHLLSREIGDIDIATSALPQQIMEIFPKTIDVGVQHGTVIVVFGDSQYEVTTFRTEEEYKDHRRPSQVAFIDSLYEDLKRRDFTMNAIAMSASGEIIDPFNGISDIKQRLITTVGKPSERFGEDALRMMRAVRFVSQLGFKLTAHTKQAISDQISLLNNISVERMTSEFEKILRGPFIKDAILLMVETSLYKFLPGLQEKKKELLFLSSYSWENINMQSEYWTLLTYMIKIEEIPLFLRQWKLSNKLIETVHRNIQGLIEVLSNGWSCEVLYDLGLNHVEQVAKLEAIINNQDVANTLITVKSQYKKLPITSRQELAINGKDILDWSDREPGKWISEIIRRTELAVLHGQIKNEKSEIKEWLKGCNLK